MKILPIPQNSILACSGGVDSMVLFHFLIMGRKNFSVIHFNHGTEYGKIAQDLIEEMCSQNKVTYTVYKYSDSVNTEHAWRTWRNNIMLSLKETVLTAHHQDDSIESFFMRCSPISEKVENIYRPMLNVSKKEIKAFARRNAVRHIDDPTNQSNVYRRNAIRNQLLPLMKKLGISPLTIMKKCTNG